MSDSDDRRYLTYDEAVEYARLSRSTLERAVREGRLRVGGTIGRRLFRREWLDEWLAGESCHA